MDLLGFKKDELAVKAQTRLKLPSLTEKDKGTISRALTDSRINQMELEFTTYHQLVDGGVTDNAPLGRAIKMLDRSGFDTIFLLLSGRVRPTGDGLQEVHGGIDVVKAAFELLWDSYQSDTLRLPMDRLLLQRTVCEWVRERDQVDKWLQELLRLRDKTNWESIGELVRSFPRARAGLSRLLWVQEETCLREDWQKWRVWVLDPPAPFLKEVLDVNPGEIQRALHEGCMRAAALFLEQARLEKNMEYSDRDASMYGKAVCDP